MNRADTNGGRLSALWQPSHNFSLKLNALLQDSERKGASQSDLRPGFGDLQQSFPRGTGTYDSQLRFYSATASARLGAATLISLTGYGENSWSDNPDYSHAPWAGLAQLVFGADAASLPEDNETRKFTQEIRFSMPVSGRLEWLLGGFYTREKTDWFQQIVALNSVTGEVAGSGLDYEFGPTTYEEYAAFTNFTFRISDRFDVQLGGRKSWNEQTHDEEGVYAFFDGFVFDPDVMRTEADSFTYLLTPRFRVTDDVMLYARFASGYRAGGPNYLTSATNFPVDFAPDKTRNYEIGAKGSLSGRVLAYDASVYSIDWEDLQVLVFDPPSGLSGYRNAGQARSRGVELSIESRPITGITLAAWVAWNDAELTEDFPAGAGNGLRGDRLPYAAEWSGRLSLDGEFPLAGIMTGFAGASYNYMGKRTGSFSTVATGQQVFGSYTQFDLRAGIRNDAWTLSTFVNNVTDERGVLTANTFTPSSVYYIQPRTIGLLVSRSF